uniref:Uncharacterized protein LOC114324943 n=1 Tax=Diabrotica virgifera virgifera TaxID=50390 RepID=A0A6P7F071_DIAVI
MNQSSSSSFTIEDIQNAIPLAWKYKILNKVEFGSPPKLEVCIKVALFTPEEIQSWVEALEEKVQCCYSIQTTRKCAGQKVLFRRRFQCQHKTRDKNLYQNSKTGSRNTNCPSRISVCLMRIQKKFRGRDPPDPTMPCIIDYVISHNHTPELAVRFRRVHKNVHEKIKQLFAIGYNASTAYEYIKFELQLNNPETYEDLIVNRSICPDRNYCHRWYNTFIKEHGAIDFTDKSFLIKKLEEYNTKMGEICTKIESTGEDFIIVLCPPLFKRIHAHIKASSEVVFMAAINPADQDGSKAFFMLTHSECGTLPLGIIFTSVEDPQLVIKGLQMLKSLIGVAMFYGKEEGPGLFVVDDCEAEQIALNTMWPESNVLFCGFHILHSLWRYLLCSRNGIPRNESLSFFKTFRQIMTAPTQEECCSMYHAALNLALNYTDYLKILHAYWEKRDMWTVAYRDPSLHEKYKDVLALDDSEENTCLLNETLSQESLLHTEYKDLISIDNSETSLCLLKGSVFRRMRSFNVIQLVDFLLTKFTDYYTERLLDAANNRLIRNMSKNIPILIDLKDIEKNNDYLYFVPSLKALSTNYAVNKEILACTCLKNSTGYICFHVGWLLTMSIPIQEKIEDAGLKELFYKIATGKSKEKDILIEELQLNSEEMEEREGKTEFNEESLMSESEVIEQMIIVDGKEVIKLEIVKDEEEQIEDSGAEMKDAGALVTSEAEAVAEGKKIISELSNSLISVLEQSPFKVVTALQKLLIQTNNLSSIQQFVIACESYAEVE